MRSLKSPYETTTLVAVPPRRLQDEYNSGRSDQQHDEHARKQIRIALGFGATLLTIVTALVGFQSSPVLWGAILFHCALHVIL